MTNKIVFLAAAACGIAVATSASAVPLKPIRLARNESGRGHRPGSASRPRGAQHL